MKIEEGRALPERELPHILRQTTRELLAKKPVDPAKKRNLCTNKGGNAAALIERPK